MRPECIFRFASLKYRSEMCRLACITVVPPRYHYDLTYPTVCTVLLELLIQLPAKCLCFLSTALGVYAVKHVVLVEAFEEGVACCIALFSI
jgi:hypothetical protein